MSSIRRSFNSAKKEANIHTDFDWATPHTLRKTAVTVVAHAASLEEGARQAGHTDDRVTERNYVDSTMKVALNGVVLQSLAPKGNGSP
ncbi:MULTISPECIES: hypothetical protein [unclassified Arthrobacter]|uniref:hypothetical protein n=1 Tax=unclassified Arthrobacter TaxID=235627 RepID=UPI001491CBA1|nr:MULTISPECIES: hypothetical protein [unclassified Arthrobacter]MBE0010553.1 hypothetical protein [Arthrobacter sp. AET 35A]NOJ64361.1 hypothetical protein [Arthrobacter sp. 147(2020)]